MVAHVEALGGACSQVVGEGAAARDDRRLRLHGMMEGRSCVGWGGHNIVGWLDRRRVGL
jgi:hypothetical protein